MFYYLSKESVLIWWMKRTACLSLVCVRSRSKGCRSITSFVGTLSILSIMSAFWLSCTRMDLDTFHCRETEHPAVYS